MHSAETKRNLNIRGAAGMKSDVTMPLRDGIRAAALLAALSALLLVATRPAHAQTETVLYDFCSVMTSGACQDGGFPESILTFHDGNYYGTTGAGGVFGSGTVFELSPNGSGGWNETVLHSFCSDGAPCPDGAFPTGPVIFDSAGNLYGISRQGGNGNCGILGYDGCGMAFELSPSGAGWTETILYEFCSQFSGGVCHDGDFPGGIPVMDAAGNLYGQVNEGVFQLSQSSGVWTFKFISQNVVNAYPGLVMDSSENIFVLAPSDTTSGYQTLFEVSPNGSGGWTTTALYAFGGPNASYWSPLALDQAGNLYGVSQAFSRYATGTVYKLSPGISGWTKKTLFAFLYNSRGDGFHPSSSMLLETFMALRAKAVPMAWGLCLNWCQLASGTTRKRFSGVSTARMEVRLPPARSLTAQATFTAPPAKGDWLD
jgi:hypothetical protein